MSALLHSPVRTTPQDLTAVQAGQVYTNLSPTGGAEGIAKFKVSDVGGYGAQWFSGSTLHAAMWADETNSKLHIDFRQRCTLSCADGSISGTAIQLGAANGSAGTDVTYVPRQGTASGGGTTIHSQYFEHGSEYWNGAARVSTGVLSRSVSLNTSGDVALQFTASTLNGDVTNTAVVQVSDGTDAIVAYGFIGDNGKGMRRISSTELRVQHAAGNDGYITFGPQTVICGPTSYFKSGYDGSATFGAAGTLGVRVYYDLLGFGTNGNTEGYASANGGGDTARKVFRWTTGLDVYAPAQTTTARVGGTLYSTITAVGNVGGGEDDLDSYTVPASTLQANGDAVVCHASFTFAAAALNSMRFRGYYGGVLFYDTTALIVAAGTLNLSVRVQRTASGAQLISWVGNTDNATVGAVLAALNGIATGARDNTASQVLKFTATLTDGGGGTANNQGVQNQMTVLYTPTP